MLDLKTIASAIMQIAEEKGIPRDKVVETVEMALAAAYKKEYGEKGEIIRAKFNPDTGDLKFSKIKLVVDESMIRQEEEPAPADALVEAAPKEPKEGSALPSQLPDYESWEGERKIRFNPERHLMLEEARKEKPGILSGEEIEYPLETKSDFGRIAAQTAKQVILQRIHEAERETVYEEFKNKEGEVVSGLLQRLEGRNVHVDLGKIIGVMFGDETIPGERYYIGERMKFFVVLVDKAPRGPMVFLSRSHPKFVSKLFSLEVPEINEGIVEIKAIAREPGSRTKIAVTSHDEAIDPIGSCVGQKGTRVSAVIHELGGEKIDIIQWTDDPTKFIANALSPAKVVDVDIRPRREARVFVPSDQLSLAIGRGGQNVRLAARLTGWKIEVRSAQKPEEVVEGGVAVVEEETPQDIGTAPAIEPGAQKGKSIEELDGVGKKTAALLREAGFDTIEKIAKALPEDLAALEGIGKKTAEKIIQSATKNK